MEANLSEVKTEILLRDNLSRSVVILSLSQDAMYSTIFTSWQLCVHSHLSLKVVLTFCDTATIIGH